MAIVVALRVAVVIIIVTTSIAIIIIIAILNNFVNLINHVVIFNC
jgi:hypothetical protein